MKICSRCHEEKELKYFSRNKQNKDGHGSYCRDCEKIRNKEYGLTEVGKQNRRNAGKRFYEKYGYTEKVYSYQKRVRQKNKNEGECIVCGKPRLEGNKNFCEYHRERNHKISLRVRLHTYIRNIIRREIKNFIQSL